jgi:ATP-dependent Clp protease ATP-binding subunit ClpA
VFERFTERARQVVVLAQSEARDLRHDYIGTEHLLLGLLREEEGLAARVLESLRVTADDVRVRIETIVGRGDGVTRGQIPFTPRAKKALELSLREALALHHDYIGTEHILLGLARERDGVAARILLELDLDGRRVRSEVLQQLAGSTTAAPHRRRGGVFAIPPSPSWEHRVERLATADDLSTETLDAIGAEGWELASVTPAVNGLVLVFKRRRESGC